MTCTYENQESVYVIRIVLYHAYVIFHEMVLDTSPPGKCYARSVLQRRVHEIN